MIDPQMFGMGGGPPGGGMPGGMPGGMGGGMPDPMATPGGPTNPEASGALSALDGLSPKAQNPSVSLQRTLEALDLAYKLISTILSQVQATNPKAAKSAHGIARSILTMKSDLFEDMTPGPVPDLMLGMAGAGAPGPGGSSAPGGGAGGMM